MKITLQFSAAEIARIVALHIQALVPEAHGREIVLHEKQLKPVQVELKTKAVKPTPTAAP